MEKFQPVRSSVAVLDRQNVDTDMIIPKQFLKTVVRDGLGEGLFFDLRFTPEGEKKPDFVLNKDPWRQAKILITGENFGCGSSREHAPWALRGFGIRVIVASRFADIFYNNCFQNALLPIVLPEEEVRKLMEQASRGGNVVFTVDLERQEIDTPDGSVPFEIDAERKKILLEGRDAIACSLEQLTLIEEFEKRQCTQQPWLYS